MAQADDRLILVGDGPEKPGLKQLAAGNGRTVSPNNVPALAAALSSLLSDPAGRVTMGQNS